MAYQVLKLAPNIYMPKAIFLLWNPYLDQVSVPKTVLLLKLSKICPWWQIPIENIPQLFISVSELFSYWSKDSKFAYHSDSNCWILFGNWFSHLIAGNWSIALNFYQQRPVFALKNQPRPQRPMKANKDQHSPTLQISLLLSLLNVKSSTNANTILKKCVFKKLEIFILLT